MGLALAAFSLSRWDLTQGLERRLFDVRFKARGTRSTETTPFQIVAVDDQTFRVLNTKWPFRGALYAQMIRNLNRAGARLIVFDIELSEPHPLFPDEDSLLAATISEAGNVILPGKVGYLYDRNLAKPYTALIPPMPVLAATGVPWGIINEITDPDDFSRRYLLHLPVRGRLKASLGLEVLRAMRQLPDTVQIQIQDGVCRLGNIAIPLIDQHSFLINYFGPQGTFPAISFSSIVDDSTLNLGVMDSNYMERFFAGESSTNAELKNPFFGKVILIGATSEELHDTKNTPFYSYKSSTRKTAGVEVHAQALQTVLDRAFIKRVTWPIVLGLNILLAILVFRLVGSFRLVRGLLLSMAVAVGMAIAAFVVFAVWNLWLDLVSLIFTTGLVYVGTSFYHYFLERREKLSIQEMFRHYVPDQVVKELISNPELLKLGGERRILSVLFADINGFTALSENIPPEQLVIFLNEYLTAMTEIIWAEGGIIDKYEGDLIMAEFGAPMWYPDHAARACRAALRMQARLKELRQHWEREHKPLLFTRIGINTGEVIVGNMGSRSVFDYTVVGDAVNLCARLEEANKSYGTSILISEATKSDLPTDFQLKPLGTLQVRGRSEPVQVFELTGEAGLSKPKT